MNGLSLRSSAPYPPQIQTIIHYVLYPCSYYLRRFQSPHSTRNYFFSWYNSFFWLLPNHAMS